MLVVCCHQSCWMWRLHTYFRQLARWVYACMRCGLSYRLSLIINIFHSLFSDIIHVQFFFCLVCSWTWKKNLPYQVEKKKQRQLLVYHDLAYWIAYLQTKTLIFCEAIPEKKTAILSYMHSAAILYIMSAEFNYIHCAFALNCPYGVLLLEITSYWQARENDKQADIRTYGR